MHGLKPGVHTWQGLKDLLLTLMIMDKFCGMSTIVHLLWSINLMSILMTIIEYVRFRWVKAIAALATMLTARAHKGFKNLSLQRGSLLSLVRPHSVEGIIIIYYWSRIPRCGAMNRVHFSLFHRIWTTNICWSEKLWMFSERILRFQLMTLLKLLLGFLHDFLKLFCQ